LDNTYGNYYLYNPSAETGRTIEAATEKRIEAIAQAMTNKTKDTWTEYGTEDLNVTYETYGIQACTLLTFYQTQSDPQMFQDFMTQIAGSLKIEKTSALGTDTYLISVLPNDYDAVGKLYLKSDLHKT
jgi:hypothetical protein